MFEQAPDRPKTGRTNSISVIFIQGNRLLRNRISWNVYRLLSYDWLAELYTLLRWNRNLFFLERHHTPFGNLSDDPVKVVA